LIAPPALGKSRHIQQLHTRKGSILS